jgi:hypothetical protein
MVDAPGDNAAEGYGETVRREGQGFVDPLPGLQKEYQAAVEQLRREVGEPTTFMERWRYWRRKRQLWRDLVARPRRSAHW